LKEQFSDSEEEFSYIEPETKNMMEEMGLPFGFSSTKRSFSKVRYLRHN